MTTVQLCRWRSVLLVGQGIRIALTEGNSHAVDSSEMAFKLACVYAFKAAFLKASPVVLEPIMTVEVCALASGSNVPYWQTNSPHVQKLASEKISPFDKF